MNSEMLDCLEDYAGLLQLAGHFENAVRAYAASTAFREAMGLPRSPHREARIQAGINAARSALGGSAFDATWVVGRTWTLEEAIDRSLASAAPVPVIV
jgi:hypothetical protein